MSSNTPIPAPINAATMTFVFPGNTNIKVIDNNPEKTLIKTFLYPDICISSNAIYIAGSAKSSPTFIEPPIKLPDTAPKNEANTQAVYEVKK